ncbi:MAG: transposase [Granulosicoccus sp.]
MMSRIPAARGLSLKSVLRCLLLKQMLGVSCEKLAFYLSDSPTYRTFTRLRDGRAPSRSSLQSMVRRISASTLHQINHQLLLHCVEQGELEVDSLRIDSTVVDSNILDPRDSQLLADGIRVLSRLMASSVNVTGVKLRFVDQRKRSKSLAFNIFHAKKAEKDALLPKLLACMSIVLRQVERSMEKVKNNAIDSDKTRRWIAEIGHYRTLSLRVVDQTQRRLFMNVALPPSDKLASLFEPHTDIIVKGQRDEQYGHMINLAT